MAFDAGCGTHKASKGSPCCAEREHASRIKRSPQGRRPAAMSTVSTSIICSSSGWELLSLVYISIRMKGDVDDDNLSMLQTQVRAFQSLASQLGGFRAISGGRMGCLRLTGWADGAFARPVCRIARLHLVAVLWSNGGMRHAACMWPLYRLYCCTFVEIQDHMHDMSLLVYAQASRFRFEGANPGPNAARHPAWRQH